MRGVCVCVYFLNTRVVVAILLRSNRSQEAKKPKKILYSISRRTVPQQDAGSIVIHGRHNIVVCVIFILLLGHGNATLQSFQVALCCLLKWIVAATAAGARIHSSIVAVVAFLFLRLVVTNIVGPVIIIVP